MLTFPLCVFFRVQFPISLLALQLFLTTDKHTLKPNHVFYTEDDPADSDSPSPAAKSPLSPSSGPKYLSPAFCETEMQKKKRGKLQRGLNIKAVIYFRFVIHENKWLTGSVRSTLSSSNTV